jgi:uncharacterized membrane protein
MSNPRFARSVFISLAVLLVVQGLFYYPRLPETMASHFNAGGTPNGFQSKAIFFLMLYAILLVVGGFLAFGVPALISTRPQIANLPNKAYWLAPERREATLAFLAAHFTWFGSAVLALGNAIVFQVIRYHLEHQPALPSSSMWVILLSFLLFVLFWMVTLFRRLAIPVPR